MLIKYLEWHFLEVPREILKGSKNILKFNLNYFSILLLLRTFFSPWKKYRWFYPRGFSVPKYFEVFVSNSMSRIIGMILRVFLIIIGVLTEVFIFFAVIFVFAGWIIFPLLLLAGLWFGIRLFF